jgi:tetratricopeptide (TPR) repeat protein
LPARFDRLTRHGSAPTADRWSAHDAWRGEAVCLVRTFSAEPEGVERMARAFRFLATTDSPHLARAYDWGRFADGSVWFTFEQLAAWPMPARADEATIRMWAIAGTRALIEGHRAGLLHRFVSPTALELTPDGQPVLTLWVFNGRPGHPDGMVTGMMPYIAPEALAGTPGPSSDFYALGAVLYAMAAGEAPHTGASGGALAQAQRSGLRSLGEHRPDLPGALVAVVDRLLAYDVADRFANGLAVLAALEAPLLPSINSPPVDHEQPLERLVRAFESFRARSGGAIVLTGATGAGKTTLLRLFAAEVALRGGVVAETRPEPGIDRMSALTAWLDERGRAPAMELPDDPAMPPAARTLLKQAAMLKRLAQASLHDGMVLVFENLGVHEEETLLRLERLLAAYGAQVMVVASVRGEEAASGKVLARLKRNPLVRELPLHAFPEVASRRLVALALGPEALELAPVRLASEAANGHPLMLLETLRALVIDGHIALGGTGWRQAIASGPLPLAPSLDSVFSARLEALPPAARHLGAVVALLDGAVATRPLVAAALDTPLTPDLALDFQTLVQQRWLTREEGGYRLAHALMAPVLLRVLSPAEQRAVHARLAALLPGLDAPDTAIAHHWAASGRRAEAAAAYERAAAAADARGATLEAFRHRQSAYHLTDDPAHRRALTERLIDLGPLIDPAFGAELIEASLASDAQLTPRERLLRTNQLVVCLSGIGRYDAARELLDGAMTQAERPALQGQLTVSRALLEVHLGRMPLAREAAAEAMALLAAGSGQPPSAQEATSQALAMGWARTIALGYRHFLGESTRLDEARDLAGELEAQGLGHAAQWPLLTAALALVDEGRLPEARAALDAVHGFLERAGNAPSAQATMLAVEALLVVRAGELDQALRDATAAVAYARTRAPHPFPLGIALIAHGEALLALGHSHQAEAVAAEALNLNEAGNGYLTGLAQLVLAEAILRRRPAEAARRLESVLLEAAMPDTLNHYLQARAWRTLGEARRALGHPDEALVALTRALEDAERHGWPYLRVQALLALARHHKARRYFGRLQRLVPPAVQASEAHGYAELARQARALSRFSVNGFAPWAELQRLLAHRGALGELVSLSLDLARHLVRTDRAAVYLCDGERPRLAGAHPAGVDPLVSGHDLLSEVLSEGQTTQREGMVPYGRGGWLVDAEVCALLAIPLNTPQGALGVLYLDRRTIQEPFSRGEAAKLEALGSYLAIAIESARARHGAASGPSLDGRMARLESALTEMLESDRVRRGFLSTITADLRHQLGQVHEAIAAVDAPATTLDNLAEALAHAERLAEILEKGIRD